MLRYCFFLLTLSFSQLPIGFSSSEENDDKLVLKPAELVNLILEERTRTMAPAAAEPSNVKGGKVVSDLNIDDLDRHAAVANEPEPEECSDDDETLRSRKVWSRWSKWGACSVSCGEGVMARRRACVAGRCARGEREEQRRACRRAPCHAADDSD